jgi:choline dehydrogenase
VFSHLQDRQDVRDLIEGVRLVREVLMCQPAWEQFRATELTPGPDMTSDGEIEAFLRAKTGTSYHPSGTCRMGADNDAVVDAEGRVKTVGRLRIVDASIMPKVTTGNLNAPVMMMAEKLADRIRGLVPLPPSAAAYHRA